MPKFHAMLFLALPLLAAACATSQQERKKAQIAHDLGIDAFNRGDFRSTLSHCMKSVEYDDTFPEAHNCLGLIYHAQRMYSQSEEHYLLAIKHNPAYSEAKNNLAALYLDRKEYDKAIPYLKDAAEDLQYGTPYIARGNLGWAQYKTGQVKEGLKNLKDSVIINPKFCWGYQKLGLIYSEQSQNDLALEAFEAFAANCPSNPDAFYRLGMELEKAGQKDKAREKFEKCVSLDPKGPVGKDCRALLPKATNEL
ncbi:MAG: Photosystem I assembly protein Ycf3 [Myxococcota bacterium]|nr:Photosystem I assembly protein Ycf3 [Myxococcota bacterium]